MGEDCIEALRQVVEKSGRKLLLDAADQAFNALGGPDRGVAVIADWPAHLNFNPTKQEFPGRSMFVRIDVPQRRPVRLAVPYPNASCKKEAQSLVMKMSDHLTAEGDEALMIGDFNLEQEERPVATLLATGKFRAADDANQASVERTGPACVIDYGIHPAGIGRARSRGQAPGVADHNFIFYDSAFGDPIVGGKHLYTVT